MILTAENVCKTIKKRKVLLNVNLELHSGRIYGITGPNGSGKTMLFRALSGLMAIDSGKIRLDEKLLHKDMEILPSLGLTIENAGLWPHLTGWENLEYLSEFTHLAGKEEISEALQRVGLDPDDTRKYHKYSLGMKQRLILAQAIMEHPDILMLDEPTNALDESGIALIRSLILEEKERGAMVLLASHNKEDIRVLADEIYCMEGGRIARG